MTHTPRSHLSLRAWRYVLLLIAIWCVMHTLSDSWLLPTPLIFGPRWLWLAPIPYIFLRRKQRETLWVPVTLALWLIVGPIMGFKMGSLMRGLDAAEDSSVLRLMTVNVGSRLVDPLRLYQVVVDEKIDIALIQECSEWVDPVFMHDRWNFQDDDALCVASRHPFRQVRAFRRDAAAREGTFATVHEMDVPSGSFMLVNVHLKTARSGIDSLRSVQTPWAALAQNIKEREDESSVIARSVPAFGPLAIVAGDFNLPVESAIYRRYWRGLRNAFEEGGWGYGYTKWTGLFGSRIDHLLLGDQWDVRHVFLGASIGSDHVPLIVELRQKRWPQRGASRGE